MLSLAWLWLAYIPILAYIYYKVYERYKDANLSQLSFFEILNVILIAVFIPLFLFLSLYFYDKSSLDYLLYIFLGISIPIFYFSKVRLNEWSIYLPLIFYFTPELHLSSLFLVFSSNLSLVSLIPFFAIVYSLILIGNWKIVTLPLILHLVFISFRFFKEFDIKGLLRKHYPILIFAAISYSFLYLSDIYSLILVIASIVVILVLKWDERIPIGYAILYLILVAIVLALNNEKFANQLAIVTYWNLVIGVLAAFIRYLVSKH